MTLPWSHLKYWKSGEWQVVQERLTDLKKKHISQSPLRADMFKALSLVSFTDTRVMIVGQDPYPDLKYATGVAFSIPKVDKYTTVSNLSNNTIVYPRSLSNLLKEYSSDLGYPDIPSSGDLTPWCAQGVLLWNAYPSCESGKSLSHHWPEWELLTQEIISSLSEQNKTVFVFLGRAAQQFEKYVAGDEIFLDKESFHAADNGTVLYFPHPVSRSTKHSFLGCRMFTKINAALVQQGLDKIEWRLP